MKGYADILVDFVVALKYEDYWVVSLSRQNCLNDLHKK